MRSSPAGHMLPHRSRLWRGKSGGWRSGAWPGLPSPGWAARYPGSSPASQTPESNKTQTRTSSSVTRQFILQEFMCLHMQQSILLIRTTKESQYVSAITSTVRSYGCITSGPANRTTVHVWYTCKGGESSYWPKYVQLCYSRWQYAPFVMSEPITINTKS